LVNYMKFRYLFLHYSFLTLLVLMLPGCHSKQEVMLSGVDVLPVDSSMSKGLAIYYRYAFYRHLNQMATGAVMLSEGVPGTPVLQLDHTFTDENIYDSRRPKGVGVFMTGYLKMEKSGNYRFKAMSNDGVQVAVNGEIVVFDPAVHGDRLSDIGVVAITAAGWYPVAVKYFQRKGTARLTLYWQPPGASDFEIVPSEVYGH